MIARGLAARHCSLPSTVAAELLDDLIDWLAIPSVSTGGGDPAAIERAADWVLERVHAAGLQPITELVRRSSLEDVFLRLTGRTLVD